MCNDEANNCFQSEARKHARLRDRGGPRAQAHGRPVESPIGKRPNLQQNAAMAPTPEAETLFRADDPFRRATVRAARRGRGKGRREARHHARPVAANQQPSAAHSALRWKRLPQTRRMPCAVPDGRANTYPSPLYEKEKYEGARTSYSCNLDVYDPLVAEIERASPPARHRPPHGEPLQGQRYQTASTSRSTPTSSTSISPIGRNMPQGGQRTWTAMIYLNDPRSRRRDRVQASRLPRRPELGRHPYLEQYGTGWQPQPLDPSIGAAGRGRTKYIVTKWYRERTVC